LSGGVARRIRRAAAPWRVVAALSITETVSWGIVYYAFSAMLLPMGRDLGASTAALTGAFSIALVVSGAAGVAVGRHLDTHGPRVLMTAGSLAATVLVIAWSQVGDLIAFYAVWCGLGLVMAAILYEPAFVVIAKQFPRPAARQRALTSLTLVAALASFIFLPLATALIEAQGWRHALLILAAVLGVITIPLHAVMLPAARPVPTRARTERGPDALDARAVLRSRAFRLLAAGFFLASLTGIAMTILAIPFLRRQGYGADFAAFAAGLIGIAQIPGRVLFAALGGRLPVGARLPAIFSLIMIGIAVLVCVPGRGATLAGLVLLGMGNGMTTLARATVIADRHGTALYGTIAGVAASVTTFARALGPVSAAAVATVSGYTAMLCMLVALTALAALCAAGSERALRSRPVLVSRISP
jgi:MFS family permease